MSTRPAGTSTAATSSASMLRRALVGAFVSGVLGVHLAAQPGDGSGPSPGDGLNRPLTHQDGRNPIVGEHDPNSLLFRLDGEATAARLRAAADAVGATGWCELWRGTLFRMDLAPGSDLRAALRTLNRLPGVRYAEPNFVATACGVPNDPLFAQQWQMDQTSDADLDMVEGWDIAMGSAAVTLAVIDTGFDLSHADLVNKKWVNPGEIAGNGLDDDGNGWIDDIHGIDPVNDDGVPQDDNGHGTFVTGVAAAEPDNGIGIAGIAWHAKVMGLKFLSASGGGLLGDAITCLDYAVAHGAAVSNHSYVTSSFSQSLMDAFDLAGDQGHLAICPGSNSSQNLDTMPLYPVCFDLPEILAITASDETDAISGFADFGKVSIDVMVPGNNIQSTTLGGGYGAGSANSYAAPTATGLAALLAAAPDAVDGQVIKDWILDTVDPLAALSSKCATGGRINARAALLRASFSKLADELFDVDGPRVGAEAGRALSRHPDLDGDGHDEIAVGCPGDKPGAAVSGSVRVVSGQTGAQLRLLSPVTQGGARFGAALALIDDVSGDGIDELLVGAPELNANGATDSGAWRLLSGADGSVLRSGNGAVNNGRLGAVLASPGDLDGDSSPEFVVGAPGESSVQVLRGSNGTQVWKVVRPATDEFGSSIATLPDVDGDGRAELLVGSPGIATAELLSGASGATLWTANYGTADRVGATVAALGDLDSDQVDDCAIANDARSRVVRLVSGATGALIRRVNFPAGETGQRCALAMADDRDRDRVPDWWVAWEGLDVVELRSGDDSLLLQAITGSAGEAFGATLLSEIDLDGDGGTELVVGAPLADPPAAIDGGRIHAFDLRELCFAITPLQPFEGDTVVGTIGGGETGAPHLIVLVDADGIPMFEILVADVIDEFGGYLLEADVPSGIAGSTFTLQAFSLKYDRPRLVQSNRVAVTVQ
jgi:subtilisin family serine protease